MANWAVVVGINQYEHLSPEKHLRFAVSDAEQVKRFLCDKAGFPEDFVVLCSDSSPPTHRFSTRPSKPNLRKILREISHHPQAKAADQAWFFFSGHGLLSQDNQNYMLTCDGVPDDLEDTALSVDYVIQQLIHCKAKNTVLVLDMCRNEAPSSRKGSSGLDEAQIVQQAQQNGIITIFSCSRGGTSYELPEFEQGAFTHAFLEGLQQHTVLKQLDSYLRDRVYALTSAKQPAQIPLIVPEPGWKYDLPLLPTCATKADISHLKDRATHVLFVDQNLDLAEQLWEQVNDLATNAEDKKLSRQLLREIDRKRLGTSINRSIVNVSTNNIEVMGSGTAGSLSLDSDPISSASIVQSPSEVPLRTASDYLEIVRQRATEEAQNFFASRLQQTNGQSNEQLLPLADDSFSEDELISKRSVDYRKLRDLLKAGQWKEADEETARVMRQAANRQEEDHLRVEDIQKFPCADLRTIDQLWVKYSKGHFGFGVQKKIWQECSSPKSLGENWHRFCVKVGWKSQDGQLKNYSYLQFDPKKSQRGELPCLCVGGGWGGGFFLLSRAETCEL